MTRRLTTTLAIEGAPIVACGQTAGHWSRKAVADLDGRETTIRGLMAGELIPARVGVYEDEHGRLIAIAVVEVTT